jgi:hypothetical protein
MSSALRFAQAFVNFFDDQGSGECLGPGEELPEDEQQALVQARLAFASQPWL